MTRPALSLAVALVLSTRLLAQDAPLTGTIDAVTVFRGQAMVTRVVDLPAGNGPREVVVSNLPEAVVIGSIYAEPAGEGVAVRSVTYRVRPVDADVREEVRKLDADIIAVLDSINANQRQAQLLVERKTYLDRLEQFSAPTAIAELKAGVLNAETLKALTIFVFEERQKLATEELKLTIERRGLAEKQQLLQRQRSELAGNSAKSLREAVVFVDFKQAGGKVRLRYLVNGATWSPSYNVRASDDRKTIAVEYNAAVQQMSGEDWSNVTMTLSTATPSLVASAPKLDALAINLVAGGGGGGAGGRQVEGFEYAEKRMELKLRQSKAESDRNFDNSGYLQAANGPAQQQGQQAAVGGDRALNRVADELQQLEFVAKDVKDKRASRLQSVDEPAVSVTYDLPGRTSLPSRSDQQLIQVASIPMTGKFYKLAVPVLTPNVYEQAMLTNAGKTVLLAGPVSSYVGGRFVGSDQIPTVAVGESFTVGFGIDSSLRASRELLDKTETTQGGNKVLDFQYRLVVQNFGTVPASVRLVDRIPTSTDPSVKITPQSTTLPPSTDESYSEAEKKQGLQRWDIDVAAGKSTSVDHKFRIEHDKQMNIAGMTSGR